MKLWRLKNEIIYIRNALKKGKLFRYFYIKHIIAPKIFSIEKVIGKKKTDSFSIHILSGKNDLTMLAWSLFSLFHSFDECGEVYIHSDGTIDQEGKNKLKKIFPEIHVFEGQSNNAISLEYPTIRKMRNMGNKYILLRKLIDPLVESNTPIRVITDSDVLWFSYPQQIYDNIRNAKQISYLMASDAQCPVYFSDGIKFDSTKASYNSGIVIYHIDNLRMGDIESFLSRLDGKRKENYHFAEQAAYAYCLKKSALLPKEGYRIKGRINENTVARHYTSPRRHMFYLEGVEKIYKDYFNYGRHQ